MSTNKKHSHHSTRQRISGDLKNLNFEVDVREKREKPESNAFVDAKALKKREKTERANAKFEKYHLANRKKLKNRWELENEFTEDFPEEKDI